MKIDDMFGATGDEPPADGNALTAARIKFHRIESIAVLMTLQIRYYLASKQISPEMKDYFFDILHQVKQYNYRPSLGKLGIKEILQVQRGNIQSIGLSEEILSDLTQFFDSLIEIYQEGSSAP